LYAKNVSTFLTYMVKDGNLDLNLDDEIISGSMFTHNGQVTHEPTSKALGD
jgi:NAD(P) transhydrogenase subunit alpha